MKKKFILICLVASMVLSLCSCTLDQGINSFGDKVRSLTTADSEEVQSVKNSYLSAYSSSVTVGDALDDFLGNTSWSYFTSDDGLDIVQCVGTCSYNDENIEAKVQFKLNDDDTFEVYAIAFNDISQSIFMQAAFMEKVYEDWLDTDDSTASLETTEPQITTEAPVSNSSSKSSRDIFVVDNDEYGLDYIGIEDGTMDQLNQKEIRLLLNALYAYHGYTFTSKEFQDFFESKPWYTPLNKSMSDCEAEFNEFEEHNKEVLVEYEKEKGWR